MELAIGFEIRRVLTPLVAIWRAFAILLSFRAIMPGGKITLGVNQGNLKLVEEGTAELWKLTKWERKWFFSLMFPFLNREIAEAFENYKTHQYTVGLYRKSFRNPTNIDQTPKASAWFLMEAFRTFNYPAKIGFYIRYAHKFVRYWSDKSSVIGIVAAVAIDKSSRAADKILQFLEKTNKPTRMTPMALIYAKSEKTLEFLEKIINRAGIFEGLRQVFFENFNEAPKEKFIALLKLIKKNKWQRFSSLVRAVDVWYGFGFIAQRQATIVEILNKTSEYLENKETRIKTIDSPDQNWLDKHIALWTEGFEDVSKAEEIALRWTKEENWEKRYLATYFLGHAGTLEARKNLVTMLTDDNKSVVIQAIYGLQTCWQQSWLVYRSEFEAIEGLALRMQEGVWEEKNVIWKWNKMLLKRQQVFDMLLTFIDLVGTKGLIKYWDSYSSDTKLYLLGKIEREDNMAGLDRKFWLRLLNDKSRGIREAARKKVEKWLLGEKDWQELIGVINNEYQDIQIWIINLINKEDSCFREKIITMLVRKKSKQSLKLETKLKNSFEPEKTETILEKTEIYDLTKRTTPSGPGPMAWKEIVWDFESFAIVEALTKLVNENRNKEVKIVERWNENGTVMTFLESAGRVDDFLGWYRVDNSLITEAFDNFPLNEVWDKWYEEYEKIKGQEVIIKLLVALYNLKVNYRDKAKVLAGKILGYLVMKNIRSVDIPLLLDKLEGVYWRASFFGANNVSLISDRWGQNKIRCWKIDDRQLRWEGYVKNIFRNRKNIVNNEDYGRFWQLLRWKDEPSLATPARARCLPEGEFLTEAYGRKLATIEDIYDNLLAKRGLLNERGFYYGKSEEALGDWEKIEFFDRAKTNELIKKFPELEEVFDKWWGFLAVELAAKSELSTPYRTEAATIKYVAGARVLFEVLKEIENKDIRRRVWGWSDNKDKYDAISNFIRVSFPKESDTLESVASLISDYKIDEELLESVILFAPQWAFLVGEATKQPGLARAVWWIVAHGKDNHWEVDIKIREMWEEAVREQTSVSSADLKEGAVDVDWFCQTYKKIGEKKWNRLYDLAKFSSSAVGHVRAKLFADAILGKLKVELIKKEIEEKRGQDKLRALGLIPLRKGRFLQKDVIDRYEFIKKFAAETKQFGSQRQASEKLAARIALDNLARNAGYEDATRMSWLLEGKRLGDLSEWSLKEGETTVELKVGEKLVPELLIKDGDKVRQSIPAIIQKNEKYQKILVKKREIRSQLSTIKMTLEKAMLDETEFEGEELFRLKKHPLLKYFIDKLVWKKTNKKEFLMGGEAEFKNEEKYRLAHTVDFYQSSEWEKWQRQLFKKKIVQPFKQVFRELYLPSDREEGGLSRRFAGHQVKERQAMALFRSRGWVTTFEGDVFKRINRDNIIVRVLLEKGAFSPGEVEGPTVEGVIFGDNENGKRKNINEIRPILFSEIMRDLDLVVSVAHEGGEVLEPSMSTVEMRGGLVAQTVDMLGLSNIKVQKNFVIINGEYGEYAVHLGSGVIHQRPGGMVFVLPIHSQFRGRIFLPFADDDPKSAEVLTKILTLANDKEIKDPDIIRQIRGGLE